MKCAVYRSTRKEYTYLYLPDAKEDFASVPETLRKLIEPLEFVMNFDLTPQRKLASEDPQEVLRHLEDEGWFLQFPKEAFLNEVALS